MERIKTLHLFLSASCWGTPRVTGLFIIHCLLRQSESKHQHSITARVVFSPANKSSTIIMELSGITGMQAKYMITFNKSSYRRQAEEKVPESSGWGGPLSIMRVRSCPFWERGGHFLRQKLGAVSEGWPLSPPIASKMNAARRWGTSACLDHESQALQQVPSLICARFLIYQRKIYYHPAHLIGAVRIKWGDNVQRTLKSSVRVARVPLARYCANGHLCYQWILMATLGGEHCYVHFVEEETKTQGHP